MATDYTKLFLAIVCILFTFLYSLNYYHNSSYYSLEIKELKEKLLEAEEKTYALGENLLNKKHTFDFKFIVVDNEGLHHEIYTHKHVLRINSEYFDILLTHNKTDHVYFYNTSKQDFLAVIDIIYLGKIRNDVHISSFQPIVNYLDQFMLLDKVSNYTDTYFAKKFNSRSYYEMNNVDIISNVYAVATKYKFHNTKLAVLNNIYYNWRVQDLFTKQYLVQYPNMFYDYIKFLRCDKMYLTV